MMDHKYSSRLLLFCVLYVCCLAELRSTDTREKDRIIVDDTLDSQERSYGVSPTKHFAFAAYYADHMVLQKAPKRAVIWGYHPYSFEFVEVSIGNQNHRGLVDMYGRWSVILDPVQALGPYVITARGSAGEITLNDVLFGDVWVCSGQSNMQFTIDRVFNSTKEIQDANNYPHIRVFAVSLKMSSKPLSDLNAPGSIMKQWAVASNKSIGTGSVFSAVCWLYGKYLYKKLGYPIGLVQDCYGGTYVEEWSSPDALAKCGITPHSYSTAGPDNEWMPEYRFEDPPDMMRPIKYSSLWNAMIHPILNMTIYGFIWYQGENNSPKPDTYNCTFTNMISDWRDKFHASHGQNDRTFPFGFVMLGAKEPNMTVCDAFVGFSELRWQQTADFGFVPNKKMPNVFMANAMDLPDFTSPYGPVHTRDKQDVSARLLKGGLAVAYNHKDIMYQAPLPSGYKVITSTHTLELVYNNGSEVLHLRNNVGFEICCSYDNKRRCNAGSWWIPAAVVTVTKSSLVITTASCESQNVAGIRYAWRLSPCTFKNCAVYSALSSLPASPFQFTSANFNKDGSYVIDTSVPHPVG